MSIQTTPSVAKSAAALDRYDRATVVLHWVTALLVVALFGSAKLWGWLPREMHARPTLEWTHVSLGILLGAVVIVRGAWRLTGSRRLPAAHKGPVEFLARAAYAVLYGLLLVQIILGFVLRWVQGETFSFFDLFTVPAIVAQNRSLEHPIENLHDWVAWAMIVVAAGHTAAALFHYYVLKDRVLARMSFERGA